MSTALILLAASVFALPGPPTERRRLTDVLDPDPAPRQRWAVPDLATRPISAGSRWLLIAAAAVLIAASVGLAAGIATAILGAVGGSLLDTSIGRRAARRTEAAVLEAVASLAAELRAGLAPSAALQAAADISTGPVGQTLREAASTAALGGDPAAVLAAPEVGGLHQLAAAWRVSARSGASLSEALDRVEGDLRAALQHRMRLEAELAGPRATACLLAGLPLLGLGLGDTMGAHPVHVLLHTVGGQLALVIGAAMDAFGMWWTGRILAAAQAAT